jgi:hypothetical protein
MDSAPKELLSTNSKKVLTDIAYRAIMKGKSYSIGKKAGGEYAHAT